MLTPDSKELGQGGYGSVRIMRDQQSGKEVACKEMRVLDRSRGSGSISYTSVREVDTLHALLGVRGIPRVVAAWPDQEGTVHLVMEKMDLSLLDLIRRARSRRKEGSHRGAILWEDTVRAIIGSMTRILHDIHEAGIIHRDLKPENVMLRGRRSIQAYLIDFGLSRVVRRGMMCHGSSRSPSEYAPRPYTPRLGTRWYRAPELLLDDSSPRYGPAVDMWSLGVIAMEMATGVCPFASRKHTDTEQMRCLIAQLGAPPKKMVCSTVADAIIRETLGQADEESICRESSRLCTKFFDHASQATGYSKDFVDFVRSCLTLDPEQRISSQKALWHPFLSSLDLGRSVSRPSAPDVVGRRFDEAAGRLRGRVRPDVDPSRIHELFLLVHQLCEGASQPASVAPLACMNFMRSIRSSTLPPNVAPDTKALAGASLLVSSKVLSSRHIRTSTVAEGIGVREGALLVYEQAVLYHGCGFRVSGRTYVDVLDDEMFPARLWEGSKKYGIPPEATSEFVVPHAALIRPVLWYWLARMACEAGLLITGCGWRIRRRDFTRAAMGLALCACFKHRTVEADIPLSTVRPYALNLVKHAVKVVLRGTGLTEKRGHLVNAALWLRDRYAGLITVLREIDGRETRFCEGRPRGEVRVHSPVGDETLNLTKMSYHPRSETRSVPFSPTRSLPHQVRPDHHVSRTRRNPRIQRGIQRRADIPRGTPRDRGPVQQRVPPSRRHGQQRASGGGTVPVR